MTHVIEARGLSRHYGIGVSQVSALRSIDLAVERGTFVAIMGTQRLRQVDAVECFGRPRPPTAGEVWLDGERIDELSEADLARLRRRKVGFVFQSFNLIPTLSAGENVELPLRLAGRRRRDARRTADRLMADLGIENRRNTAPAVLSGGEQQRVALARALANAPDIVFADEPTGNLDSAAAKDVLGLLRSVRERGQTLLVVTHDARVAAAADRVITLRDGQVSDETALGAVRQVAQLLELGGRHDFDAVQTVVLRHPSPSPGKHSDHHAHRSRSCHDCAHAGGRRNRACPVDSDI